MIWHESLGPAFDKWHLNPNDESHEFPHGCRPVIHRLGVDEGMPHDHPWSFHTFVLHGGYEEEVFTQRGDAWHSALFRRFPGEARYVPAGTVHRVVRLLNGPCFTVAMYGPQEREWRYYPEAIADARPDGVETFALATTRYGREDARGE